MPSPPKFTLPQRIQREYAAGIRQIIGRVLQPKMPEQSLADWLKSLAERSKAQDIQDASNTLAQRMVSWCHASNCKTWRAAAAKSTNARKLYTLLQKELTGTATGARIATIIRENAAYISSLPLEAAQTLTDEVTKAQQAGARPGTISKMMRARFPELLRSRVQLISRTETAKASLALTQARCADIGVNFAEWMTSEDARVRPSHKAMDKIIFALDDLPDPEVLHGEPSHGHYGPGGIFNCRCTIAPLLSIDDVTWPRKVHRHGTLQQMNKQQFLTAFNLQKAA